MTYLLLGNEYDFITSDKIFSLHNIDRGTRALLSVLEIKKGDRVLDLGCGCGVVSVACSGIVGPNNVYISDVDPDAVEIAIKNMKLNNFEPINFGVTNGFQSISWNELDLIISNPPYHVNFSVPKEFIEKGFNRLKNNGKLYMVTKRKEWYKRKISSIFGGVKIQEVDGYYIFVAEKKTGKYANATSGVLKKSAKTEPQKKKKIPRKRVK